ncbi:hypothetical protein XA26_23150 [Mycolicibacterium fortuitum]|uniref:Uncharacterized protein n=1 Tax=Mycolicibacterium fortuitum TaxID=1766 RepID=A0A0N9Y8H2_MYCFO|nr:hypothetical protein G155_00118 [Mycobacterium sp. VKM Ac-1817D]ALI26160.1 hypothetical protein XA26_23150 [Mycolicibacterium fortuitum]
MRPVARLISRSKQLAPCYRSVTYSGSQEHHSWSNFVFRPPLPHA